VGGAVDTGGVVHRLVGENPRTGGCCLHLRLDA
jgi:hypothetical protein